MTQEAFKSYDIHVRPTVALSDEARRGDFAALDRDLRAAGWGLRLKRRRADSVYSTKYDLCAIRKWTAGDGHDHYDPVTGKTEQADTWWMDDRRCVWAFASSLEGAVRQIVAALDALPVSVSAETT